MTEAVRLTVEGMDELRATFRRLGGPEMVKQLGQVHKRVGELVIAKAGGTATGVGTGTGSTIRASAATRAVVLRVGGRFRSRFGAWRQWGIDQMWPPPPERPYIIGAAVAAQDEILDAYLDGVSAITAPIRIERS